MAAEKSGADSRRGLSEAPAQSAFPGPTVSDEFPSAATRARALLEFLLTRYPQTRLLTCGGVEEMDYPEMAAEKGWPVLPWDGPDGSGSTWAS